jgi:putative NIF3 family GTP cyclohydrolase 1 type 2
MEGLGTFRAGEGANPFVGEKGVQHIELETRVEVIFHAPIGDSIVAAMLAAHPYEEVAYDVYPLSNAHPGVGSGAVGELESPLSEQEFLAKVKGAFAAPMVRHTALLKKPVKRVAVCGGAGAFLISKALGAKADAYVTADVKYHEFFGAENRLLLVDIGHFESEQFTMHLIQRRLKDLMPTFAAHLTESVTNPIHVC